MRTVVIPYLNWTIPVLALQLAIVAVAALGVALIVTWARIWADLRADRAAWETDPDAAGWDDYEQAAALQMAAEARWAQDLAEIRADEQSIDQWRDAGYPADRQPYAITAAEERRERAQAARRLDALICAEMLVRLAK